MNPIVSQMPEGGSPMAEEMPPMPEAMSPAPMEHALPLESLQQPDNSEQMQAPEVGDEVNYSVTGKVSRIEGERVYVTPMSVNGKEIEATAEAETGDDLASLEAAAKGMSL